MVVVVMAEAVTGVDNGSVVLVDMGVVMLVMVVILKLVIMGLVMVVTSKLVMVVVVATEAPLHSPVTPPAAYTAMARAMPLAMWIVIMLPNACFVNTL